MKETLLKRIPERIEVIDVLRGFALAGILYAHMVFWYTGAALPEEVYFQFSSFADNVSMAIFGAFVFGKFFSVFSFLFGLSFYLHFQKKKTTSGFLKIYLWRLSLLLLIGIVHHLFWRGDILAIYAVLGGLLMLFRKLPLKLLLLFSIVLITNLPSHLYELFLPPVQNTEVNFPMAEEAERYYALVQKGDLVTNLRENRNSWDAKIRYQLESGRLLMTLGYFLLGLWAGRSNLFTLLKENIEKFRSWNKVSKMLVLTLLLIGLLMYLFDLVTLPQLHIVPELKWTAGFLFSIYNACLTIFYISGITLLFQSRSFNSLLKPLAVMGRMALTNYLLQTLFGLLIFYRFGFGLFEQTSPAINILLTVLVFYFQLKFSEYWLARHKQGPVEWLWKSLTYFRFYSNKKRNTEAVSS
ncbi:DUF418 domain-containing protein [Salinimicrobium sp. CDJ15-81-2]|nr:DUF418 domain-containing protein [Salinimicrobium nanhaiense]